jgi:hypothetical protein
MRGWWLGEVKAVGINLHLVMRVGWPYIFVAPIACMSRELLFVLAQVNKLEELRGQGWHLGFSRLNDSGPAHGKHGGGAEALGHVGPGDIVAERRPRH